MLVECAYGGPPHSYPDDHIFGGADGTDPRADPRWQPTTYIYYDVDTTELEYTQTPLCDDQALDEFTQVAQQIKGSNPYWVAAKRPGGKLEMLPWLYDLKTDTVYPFEVKNGRT